MSQEEISCPKCKKQNPAWILYGMPGPIGKEDDEKENIVYGGCGDYGYDYECQKCFYQWAEDKPQSGEYNEWDSMTHEGEYKNGKPHGIWTTRTRLGVKWFDRTFNMGEIEGKVILYDEEGIKKEEHFADSDDDDANDIKVQYNKQGNIDRIYNGDEWIEGDKVKNYKVIEYKNRFELIPKG